MSADFFLTEVRYKAGKEFIKMAAKYGARLVRSKKHNIFRDAAGRQITAPKTTSDFRAIKNFEAELRGRGFVNQETIAKVKDNLVKGSNVTAVPSRRTANQQTTFSDFTRRYQPNVQGPRKPNTPPRVRVQGPESELAHRHRTAFDKRLDAVIKDIRGTRAPMPASVRSMPKPLTADEMEKLRRLNLTPKLRRRFREMGLLPEGLVSEKYTQQQKDAKTYAQYKDVTNPKKPVDPIRALKLKKV